MITLRSSIHRVCIAATVFLSLPLTAPSLRAGEIHDAAAAGDLAKVKALLEADPTLLESKDDRDRDNLKGNTPLISACWGPGSSTWQATTANFLIDKGANSPDGKFLFFTGLSARQQADVYWVETASVAALHSAITPPQEKSK